MADMNDIKPGMSTDAAAKVARDISRALRGDQDDPINPYAPLDIPALPAGASTEQKTEYDRAVTTLKNMEKQGEARIAAIMAKPAGAWTREEASEVAKAIGGWDQGGRRD